MTPGPGRAGRRSTVAIVVARAGSGPEIELDAVVVEDDTYRVLGADRVVKETAEPLGRLLMEAAEHESETPGTIVVEEGTAPLRIHAVVYDLDAEPMCREEWAAAALAAVVEECVGRGLRSLAMPPLGVRLDALAPDRSIALLAEALAAAPPGGLEMIWLAVPQGFALSALEGLEGFDVDIRI
jgi:hypothetical protein